MKPTTEVPSDADEKLNAAGVGRHGAAWLHANVQAAGIAKEAGLDLADPKVRQAIQMIVLRAMDEAARRVQ